MSSRITVSSRPRRAALWRRPKVLVAGLASRVEAALDDDGSVAGAVGTWTITHPKDDRAALAKLTDALNAEEATEALEDELGATRMGKGSKMILIGDLGQIDNPYVDAHTNGLVYTRNRLQGQEFMAHVNLFKGERSAMAEVAANLM